MTDVPEMLKKIKALEATVQDRESQLRQQQQQLCDVVQVSKRARLYGLNDVKTVGTRLRAMRETHVNFCTKYADGKTSPKTLPTRTRLLEFLDVAIGQFEEEFSEHFAALAAESNPKKKLKKVTVQ